MSNGSDEVQQWMRDVAQGRTPKRRLIFDKRTKTLVPVDASDPRADENLSFTPKEATRYGGETREC